MLPPAGMMVGAILAGLLLEYSGFLSVTVTFILVSVVAVLTLFALSKNSTVVGVKQRGAIICSTLMGLFNQVSTLICRW